MAGLTHTMVINIKCTLKGILASTTYWLCDLGETYPSSPSFGFLMCQLGTNNSTYLTGLL